MEKKIEGLKVRRRELMGKLGEIKDIAEKRELNAEEQLNEKKLLREFQSVTREIDEFVQDSQLRALQPAEAPKSENEQLREFVMNAKPGSKFEFAVKREAISTTGTTPYVQGVTVQDIISTDRPDADVLAAAGVPMVTGVVGNKIQWAYMGGVEAVFANELAQTTERKVDLDAQTPVQQRLTVRVRVSQQSLENSNFDLRGLFVSSVQRAIREKINWAATSTAKATETFFGGFAQDAEKGTYGQTGYTPGKQTGTYSELRKELFAEMIGKLAARNIPLNNVVFVLGAEDYWLAKVTPTDAGSGIMLLGADNKLLGIPVICSNAINKATQKGAASGHNIGLGNFGALPTMQHGNIRLSIDDSSAVAADTDEVIITINADFSMTILKSMADAFVVYSKQA